MSSQCREQNSPDLVDIVVACFNSAKWIDEFVAGLFSVDDAAWRLVVRDDGSTDDTLSLLKKWKNKLGDRMILMDPESPRNLGLIKNYDAVLSRSTAAWVLTADPDDVWLPPRLPLTLKTLKEAEAQYGQETPIAVCADAMVVDGDLNLISPSYWRWSMLKPQSTPTVLRTALDSVALGTTMALNRALLDKSLPIPDDAAYPDQWMTLVAVAFGRLIALPTVTVKYRRHGQNAMTDPLSRSLARILSRITSAPRAIRARVHYLINRAAKQAGAFLDRYETELPVGDAAGLRKLALLPQARPATKRLWIIRHRLWFGSFLKNVGLIVFI